MGTLLVAPWSVGQWCVSWQTTAEVWIPSRPIREAQGAAAQNIVVDGDVMGRASFCTLRMAGSRIPGVSAFHYRDGDLVLFHRRHPAVGGAQSMGHFTLHDDAFRYVLDLGVLEWVRTATQGEGWCTEWETS